MEYTLFLDHFKATLQEKKAFIKQQIESAAQGQLVELSPDLLLITSTKEGSENITLHIGFPFPIHSFSFTAKDFGENHLEFFVRGAELRTFQYQEFCNTINTTFKESKRIECTDTTTFKDIISSINSAQVVYIDPYDFLGDFAIGTYFVKNIMESSQLNLCALYSKSAIHLSNETKVYSLNVENIKKIPDNSLVILPNLIDNQQQQTLNIIKELSSKNLTYFILGRNIVLTTNSRIAQIYHLNTEEVLLRNMNIYDYMDLILKPFLLNKTARAGTFSVNNSTTILINPFAREETRVLDIPFLKNIVQYVSEKGYHIELVGGFRDKAAHQEWLTRFEEQCKGISYTILYFSNLSELNRLIISRKYFLLITPDTSINHYSTRYGQLTLSVYNYAHWNTKSMQALAGASPLGFNPYEPYNLPLCYTPQLERNAVKKLIELLEKQKGKTFSYLIDNKLLTMDVQKDLEDCYPEFDFLKHLYNPEFLVKDITYPASSPAYLISSAIKTSPCYKLSRLLHHEA